MNIHSYTRTTTDLWFEQWSPLSGRARINQTSDAIKRHFNRNIKSDIKVTTVLQLYYSFANAMVYPQVYVVPEVKDDILRQGNFCQFEELFNLI